MEEVIKQTVIPDDFSSEGLTDLLKDILSNTEIESTQDKVKGEKLNIFESESTVFSEEFYRKGFISGESWDKTINIHSRILQVSKEFVTCECIIDKEEKIFQTRTFPAFLFSHIEPLQSKKPILVKIRSKAGSSRVDIYDGKRLVDLTLFDLKDNWDLLNDSNLDSPLKL